MIKNKIILIKRGAGDVNTALLKVANTEVSWRVSNVLIEELEQYKAQKKNVLHKLYSGSKDLEDAKYEMFNLLDSKPYLEQLYLEDVKRGKTFEISLDKFGHEYVKYLTEQEVAERWFGPSFMWKF